ncbi:MAG TPA: hypothetical protein VHN39_02345 [Phenylobacterium sp.]|nr:hypothetical protein [Phenylobacterium sp.]
MIAWRGLRPALSPLERPLGETFQGKDAQIEAAVAELLKGLPKAIR